MSANNLTSPTPSVVALLGGDATVTFEFSVRVTASQFDTVILISISIPDFEHELNETYCFGPTVLNSDSS